MLLLIQMKQWSSDLVAKEVSAIVNYDSNKDKASRAKASNSATPSTSTSNTSRVHIQETRNKRFTPAQQQRQEIYKSMVALFEAENKREDKEDEIDMAFTACAVRMCIHLNKDQIEDVIQEVEGVVRRAINNVRKGMPALTPSPVPFMQPGANVIQSQMSGLVPIQQHNNSINSSIWEPRYRLQQDRKAETSSEDSMNREHTATHRCSW